MANQDENLDKKLKKNRESAKNSRQRKKVYIKLLEKKVKKKYFLNFCQVTELTNDIDVMASYIEKS